MRLVVGHRESKQLAYNCFVLIAPVESVCTNWIVLVLVENESSKKDFTDDSG